MIHNGFPPGFPPPPPYGPTQPVQIVDHMLGESYYVVKTVYMNLQFLRNLGDALNRYETATSAIASHLSTIETLGNNASTLFRIGVNLDDLEKLVDNMGRFEVLIADLDGREVDNVIDYGLIGDGKDTAFWGGGHIKIVADNIDDVVTVGDNIDVVKDLAGQMDDAQDLWNKISQAKTQIAQNTQTVVADTATVEADTEEVRRLAAQAAEDATSLANIEALAKEAQENASESADQACSCAAKAVKAANKAQRVLEDKAQADWSQPDEEENSYVKNRTHYPVYTTQETYEDVLEATDFTVLTGESFATLDQCLDIDEDTSYIVTYDGEQSVVPGSVLLSGQSKTVTTTIVRSNTSGSICGCAAENSQKSETVVTPYGFRLQPGCCTTKVYAEEGDHTLQIQKVVKTHTHIGNKKLDPVFLPAWELTAEEVIAICEAAPAYSPSV